MERVCVPMIDEMAALGLTPEDDADPESVTAEECAALNASQCQRCIRNPEYDPNANFDCTSKSGDIEECNAGLTTKPVTAFDTRTGGLSTTPCRPPKKQWCKLVGMLANQKKDLFGTLESKVMANQTVCGLHHDGHLMVKFAQFENTVADAHAHGDIVKILIRGEEPAKPPRFGVPKVSLSLGPHVPGCCAAPDAAAPLPEHPENSSCTL